MTVRPTVAERLDAVRAVVADAARRVGRDPSDVTVVVVTKNVDAARVRDAIAAGARELGENRAQEMHAKVLALGDDASAVRWHFIGRLQRNKVRMVAPYVTLWESIDRLELGRAVAHAAPGAQVLVQVNVAGEAQKGGCAPSATPALVDGLRDLGLDVAGVMTVPPAAGDPRPVFASLRVLAADLRLPHVSMGMSGDYATAIEEGATIVRVGTAVFGPRPA